MQSSDEIFRALSAALKLRGRIEERRGPKSIAVAYNETHRLIAEWRRAKAAERKEAR